MKDKLTTTRRIMAVMFILIIAFLGLYVANAEIQTDSQVQMKNRFCEVYESEWEQIHPDGTRETVHLPGQLTSEDKTTVDIESILPAEIDDDAYLIFRSNKQNLTIWVDGELRQKYDAGETIKLGDISPNYAVFVKLHREDAGKVIHVHSYCRAGNYGLFNTIYYANESGYWYHLYHQDGHSFMMGIIMLVVGITTLVFSLLMQFVYGHMFKTTHLSVTAILVSLWILSNSGFRQLFFANVSIVGDIGYFTVMALPIPVGRYVNQIQNGRYVKAYTAMEAIAIADIIFCFVTQYFNILHFHQTFYLMITVMGATILVILGTMLVDFIKGQIYSYRLFAIGLVIFLSVGVIQVGEYLRNSSFFTVGFAGVALLLMLLIATMETIFSLMEIQKERQDALTTSKMKSQFLANMSHEIRTPMNAIIGLNELILQESKESQIRDYAKDVNNSSHMLLNLINDILDYSAIESGKIELQVGTYSLRTLLDSLFSTVKIPLMQKNLSLEVEVAETLPEALVGDAVRIQQILLNILTNAVKYTKEGGVKVTVSGEPVDKDRLQLIVAVQDTGIGMKEEDISTIFDSFQRVDLQKNRTIEGTGLGLAITKQLIDRMDGTIQVESVYGKGSTFTVTIPQKIAGEATIGQYSLPAQQSPETTQAGEQADTETITKANTAAAYPTFPGKRVLAVDDVKMNLTVFKGLLKHAQLEIVTAQSGAEALQQWENHSFDLVFLDDMMPEMDGVTCMHHMRETDTQTPIVMLTANVIDGAEERYLQEGFSGYLSKPVQQAELYRILEQLLNE